MNPSSLVRFTRTRPVVHLGPMWLFSQEVDIRAILASPEFGKGGMWDALNPLLGNGLILSTGVEHRCQRVQLGGALNGKACADMEATARQIIARKADMMAGTYNEQPFDLAADMRRLSERVVLRCLFGSNLPADLGQHIHAAIGISQRRMMAAFGASLVPGLRSVPVAKWNFIGAKEFASHMGIIRLRLGELITNRPAWLPADLSPEQAIDQLLTMYVAATDTTAAALTWLLALLGGVKREGGDWGDYSTTRDAIDAAIKMTLTVAPPIWFFPRTALADVEFESSVRRLTMKRGDTAILLTLGTECADLAFGDGKRKCIGERFAKMVMRIVMEEFGQRFRLELDRKADMTMKFGLTLWPRRATVRMRLK